MKVWKVVKDYGPAGMFSALQPRHQFHSKDPNPLCVRYQIGVRAEGYMGTPLFAFGEAGRTKRFVQRNIDNLAILECEAEKVEKCPKRILMMGIYGMDQSELHMVPEWFKGKHQNQRHSTSPTGTILCYGLTPTKILWTSTKFREI